MNVLNPAYISLKNINNDYTMTGFTSSFSPQSKNVHYWKSKLPLRVSGVVMVCVDACVSVCNGFFGPSRVYFVPLAP